MCINVKRVFTTITIKINVDQVTYNIVIFFAVNKNAIINIVSFLIISYNNYTIQIGTKLNSANFIQEIYKNANIKVSAHLLIHKIKLLKILN